MDILHSPVEVGAGDEGSDDKNDCGSLLHPVPINFNTICIQYL